MAPPGAEDGAMPIAGGKTVCYGPSQAFPGERIGPGLARDQPMGR
jgi:hypothetical protein